MKKKIYTLLFLTLALGFSAWAQTTYTSAANGPWTSAATWDANGSPGISIGANDIVIINHNVSVANDQSTSLYTVTNNGTIKINSGKTLRSGADDWGTDYLGKLINADGGVIEATGTFILHSSAGSATFNNGSVFEYKKNAGVIPSGITWNTGSLLKLTAVTDTMPGFPTGNTYADFEFACPGLTADVQFTHSDASSVNDVNISNTANKDHAVLTDAGDDSDVSGDLSVGANGKLKVTNGGTLTVAGTTTVAGTMIVNDSCVLADTLTLSGALEINTENGELYANASSNTITSLGVLTINAKAMADIDSLTNNHGTSGIIITSNSSGFTGSLITSSTGVQGTFEQEISDDRWWLITPPFSNLDSYDFWDNTNDAYMRPYNSPGGGWGDYYGSGAESLSVGEGYEYWPTADFSFSESGTFITGDQTLSVTAGGTVDTNWNLVGNPYPCGLDWAKVDDRTNAEGSAFYVYTSSGYKTDNGDGTGTAGTSIIPPFQGFFVQRKKSGGSNNITIKDEDKARQDKALFKSTKNNIFNVFKVKSVFNESVSETVIYKKEGATNGNDYTYDAPVLFNNDPNFPEVYSLAGDKKAVMNLYGDYPYNVNLGFRVPEGGGEFTIEATDFRNDDGAFTIILEDMENGNMQSFKEGEPYTFTINQSGMIEDRIVLHLNSTVGVEDIEAVNTTIYSSANTIYIQNNDMEDYDYQVINMMGQVVTTGRSNAEGLYAIHLNEPTAYYVVKVIKPQGTITKKLYIQN